MNEAVAAWSDEEHVKALSLIEEAERRKKLIYFRTLIYYVTGYDIASIDYFEPRKQIIVRFKDACREVLFINIHTDSIEACTCEVIRQTINYVERND
jgi:hypothetical protein